MYGTLPIKALSVSDGIRDGRRSQAPEHLHRLSEFRGTATGVGRFDADPPAIPPLLERAEDRCKVYVAGAEHSRATAAAACWRPQRPAV